MTEAHPVLQRYRLVWTILFLLTLFYFSGLEISLIQNPLRIPASTLFLILITTIGVVYLIIFFLAHFLPPTPSTGIFSEAIVSGPLGGLGQTLLITTFVFGLTIALSFSRHLPIPEMYQHLIVGATIAIWLVYSYFYGTQVTAEWKDNIRWKADTSPFFIALSTFWLYLGMVPVIGDNNFLQFAKPLRKFESVHFLLDAHHIAAITSVATLLIYISIKLARQSIPIPPSIKRLDQSFYSGIKKELFRAGAAAVVFVINTLIRMANVMTFVMVPILIYLLVRIPLILLDFILTFGRASLSVLPAFVTILIALASGVTIAHLAPVTQEYLVLNHWDEGTTPLLRVLLYCASLLVAIGMIKIINQWALQCPIFFTDTPIYLPFGITILLLLLALGGWLTLASSSVYGSPIPVGLFTIGVTILTAFGLAVLIVNRISKRKPAPKSKHDDE